jgi:hypothetical protein
MVGLELRSQVVSEITFHFFTIIGIFFMHGSPQMHKLQNQIRRVSVEILHWGSLFANILLFNNFPKFALLVDFGFCSKFENPKT